MRTMDRSALEASGAEFAEIHGKSYAFLFEERVWSVWALDGAAASEIGGSIDRANAEVIAREAADGTSAARAARFLAWFDEKVAAVRPEVAAAARAAGLQPTHTGGGCMAWERILPGGEQLLMTTEDADFNGDPEAVEWIVGRYGALDGFVSVGPLTLAEAVAVADRLPSPVAPDGTVVEVHADDVDSLDAALAQAAESVARRM